ncbi:MAG: hypothetical protein HY842_16950 [Bacteroidetes bacterium]|nr:hypothetical protein [Bacteroidota bacterium]
MPYIAQFADQGRQALDKPGHLHCYSHNVGEVFEPPRRCENSNRTE